MRTIPAGTGTRRRWLVAGLAAVASTALLPATPAQAQAGPISQAFTEPGDRQLVVPAGVTQMTVTATGAGGGGGGTGDESGITLGSPGSGGGGGGTVSCTITVDPGSTLYLHVGEAGQGGKAEVSYGTQGGQSTLRTSPDNVLVRADGGGGGATAAYWTDGGAGGSAGCTGANVVTLPGTAGEESGTSINGGGYGGAAGSPIGANCPERSGRGGDGPNGTLFGAVDGYPGNDGCIVVTYPGCACLATPLLQPAVAAVVSAMPGSLTDQDLTSGTSSAWRQR